jgi:hypothetical protein
MDRDPDLSADGTLLAFIRQVDARQRVFNNPWGQLCIAHSIAHSPVKCLELPMKNGECRAAREFAKPMWNDSRELWALASCADTWSTLVRIDPMTRAVRAVRIRVMWFSLIRRGSYAGGYVVQVRRANPDYGHSFPYVVVGRDGSDLKQFAEDDFKGLVEWLKKAGSEIRHNQ